MAKDGEIKYKIGLVGESGVGKSCLLVRWVDNDFFEADDKYTIGVDFKYKTVQVKDKSIKLQIHDTAGQERFRTVTASFYRGAHGILLVFDITDKESFEGKVTEWLREVRNYTPDNTPVVLVGNKLDKADERAVDHETAKQFADQNKLRYFETSAKEGTNVNEAFMALTQQIVDQKMGGSKVDSETIVPVVSSKTKKEKSRCMIL